MGSLSKYAGDLYYVNCVLVYIGLIISFCKWVNFCMIYFSLLKKLCIRCYVSTLKQQCYKIFKLFSYFWLVHYGSISLIILYTSFAMCISFVEVDFPMGRLEHFIKTPLANSS